MWLALPFLALKNDYTPAKLVLAWSSHTGSTTKPGRCLDPLVPQTYSMSVLAQQTITRHKEKPQTYFGFGGESVSEKQQTIKEKTRLLKKE